MASRIRLGTKWLSILSLVGAGVVGGCADATDVSETLPETGGAAQQAAATQARSNLDLPVKLRGTGSATIRAVITENSAAPAQGATLLDVHGLGTTGRVFDPLTGALFADPQQGPRVRRVITIDMVGHGGSTFPTGLPRGTNFGSLTIDDNVSVLRQVVEGLRAQSLGPQMIVGHSLGALTITALQQTLLNEGSNLSKLGISIALLIAPIPATGQPWTQPSTAEASKLEPYFVVDNSKGIYLSVPADIWLQSSFSDRSGKRAANAPTAQQVTSAGYMGPEPVYTLLQVFETGFLTVPKRNRPSVSAGAFAAANATRLAVVGFSEDQLVSAADARAYYTHLTGDTTGKNYLDITFPDAVHNMTIVNPSRVIDAMKVLFP